MSNIGAKKEEKKLIVRNTRWEDIEEITKMNKLGFRHTRNCF